MSSNLSIRSIKPIEWMLAVLIVLAPLYYHYNLGGSGFRIPSNITVWAAASVIIFYSLYKLASAQTIILPRYSLLLLAFPVLAIYGAMMAGIIIPAQWFFRLLFIIGGTFFFFALFQFKLSQSRVDRLFLLIVIAAFLHACVGLAQIILVERLPSWLPFNKSGMPTGIFQQINNQGSFQVTGLLLSFWLLTRPVLNQKRSAKLIFILIFISVSSFIVAYSGSRIAVLGFILAVPLLLLSRWKFVLNHKLRWLIVISLLLASVISASKYEDGRGLNSVAEKTAAMNAGFSGSARLGMYSIAFDEIKKSPWFGYGIGSFVGQWQSAKPEFYRNNPDAFLPNSRVTHPHNEIIFWLVEGGVVVTSGLALLLLAVIFNLALLPRSRRYAYAALILPIALHTQVELPFYISSIHWFTFLFILFVSFNSFTRQRTLSLSLAARATIKFITVISALVTFTFLVHTMLASFEIKSFIKNKSKQHEFNIAVENPYFKQLMMEQMMNRMLYRSIQSGQKQNVKDIAVWMDTQLVNNPHFMYFQSLTKAYTYLGDQDKACQYIKDGNAIYPQNAFLSKVPRRCYNNQDISN